MANGLPDPLTHLSASSVKTYLMCPRRFAWEKLSGLPRPAAGLKAARGSALHAGLEAAFKTPDDGDRRKAAESATKERWHYELAKADAAPKEKPDSIVADIPSLLTDILEVFKDTKPLSVEQEVDGEIGGVRVVGRVDWTTAEAVEDLKITGRAKKPAAWLGSPQTGIYTALTGQPVNYHQFTPRKTMPNKYEPVRLSGAACSEAAKRIEDTVSQIARGINSGVFPRREGDWHCSEAFCPFWGPCIVRREDPC